MYRALNEKSYWLIDLNIRKTPSTSIDFPFQSPKLSWESSFAFSLNYTGICKERSSKQVTDNFQRRAPLKKIVETLKKINFQFQYRKFSQPRDSILSYYYWCVTRGTREGLTSCTFFNIGRKCPDFGNRCTDFGHICVKFLILSALVEQFEGKR